MCGCTSSFGPDRYGPRYLGRYGFQEARFAASPLPDPYCPTCRVGAFAPGQVLPPVAPAGQTASIVRQLAALDRRGWPNWEGVYGLPLRYGLRLY